MPYGPSVPHMFIVIFVIMLPIYLTTKDPMQAWTAGIAWAFIIGVIVLIGAFVGPYIRKYTPRAALLGTLAGISITFISMNPAGNMWKAAWIALPVFGLLLIGLLTDVKLPFNIPIGLAALLVGTAIGWIGGAMSVPDVTARRPGHRASPSRTSSSTCWSTASRTWRRCWPPRSRWASTTSPRR